MPGRAASIPRRSPSLPLFFLHTQLTGPICVFVTRPEILAFRPIFRQVGKVFALLGDSARAGAPCPGFSQRTETHRNAPHHRRIWRLR